jgi:DNA anti-recombination protein RmuC
MAAEPLVQTAWPTNREEDAPMPARRWTDASKLSFPLQLVVTIVAGFLAAAFGVWTAQGNLEKQNTQLQIEMRQITAQLASDVRNILTSMEAEKRVSDANAKLAEANNATLSKTIDEIKKLQQLQQLQIAEIQKVLPGRR